VKTDPSDVSDIVVDRAHCTQAAWPEDSLLDHYEKHSRRDPRIQSVTAYERMARDAIRKGHIFWFKYQCRLRSGFYNSRAHVLTVVSRDQSRILTCITSARLEYVENLFCNEGAGRLVDWPNCPFYWEETG